MMAPPWPWPSWPPAGCLPKDEGFLTLTHLGQREAIKKSWGERVDTDLLGYHGQVVAPVWASVSSLEELGILNIRIPYKSCAYQ